MMRRGLAFSIGFLATVGLAAAADDFHWSGKVASGGKVEVENVNGGITATPSEGSQVEVVAVKKAGHKGDPADVNIKVVEGAGGVLICTVYGPVTSSQKCDSNSVKNNDTNVEYTIKVPTGVSFRAETVNGGVTAKGLSGAVDAETVNGGVHLEGTGSAKAETVNGGIHVILARMEGTEALHFETVNGGIVVELPADARASLNAETVNGSIQSDFPVAGKFGKHELKATIGGGGRDVKLETVNGSIEIRKKS